MGGGSPAAITRHAVLGFISIVVRVGGHGTAHDTAAETGVVVGVESVFFYFLSPFFFGKLVGLSSSPPP